MRPSDNPRLAEYDDFANVLEAALHNFEELLKATPTQNPQNVADAVLSVIEQPVGKRSFRTTMHKVTEGIYGNLCVADMLEVKA